MVGEGEAVGVGRSFDVARLLHDTIKCLLCLILKVWPHELMRFYIAITFPGGTLSEVVMHAKILSIFLCPTVWEFV